MKEVKKKGRKEEGKKDASIREIRARASRLVRTRRTYSFFLCVCVCVRVALLSAHRLRFHAPGVCDQCVAQWSP